MENTHDKGSFNKVESHQRTASPGEYHKKAKDIDLKPIDDVSRQQVDAHEARLKKDDKNFQKQDQQESSLYKHTDNKSKEMDDDSKGTKKLPGEKEDLSKDSKNNRK